MWRVDPGQQAWDLLQTVPADDADPATPKPPGAIPANPSFLILNRDGTRLYTVHGDATTVSAFAVDPAHGTVSHLRALKANPSATNPLLMGRAGVQRHIDGTWQAM